MTTVTPRWVKASDRLPEEGQNILFIAFDKVHFGNYWWEQGHFAERFRSYHLTGTIRIELKDVSAWMPVPLPPSSEESPVEGREAVFTASQVATCLHMVDLFIKNETGYDSVDQIYSEFLKGALPAAPPSSAEGEVKEKDIEEFAEMMFNAGREFMIARNEFLYDDFEHWKEGGGYHLNGSFKWSNVVPSLLPAPSSDTVKEEGAVELLREMMDWTVDDTLSKHKDWFKRVGLFLKSKS